ncbi:hypothetical protein Acr_28g0003140 [Actinidia rufa]|uniref:Uncharacterized protein n=1 Tax=Actinidia rufa TaxID=165716 RepID=A0A7J0H966_9ERIC|nr:hypothetical protein Acr_28g0003140 [Actinidia rufa]
MEFSRRRLGQKRIEAQRSFHHHTENRVTTNVVTPVHPISNCDWIWRLMGEETGRGKWSPNLGDGEKREKKFGRWPNPRPSPNAKQGAMELGGRIAIDRIWIKRPSFILDTGIQVLSPYGPNT